MALLFSGVVYFSIRAMEAKSDEKNPLPWLAGVSVLFGLLALTHGITIWVFAGALLFCGIYFTPRFSTLSIMLGIFLVIYTPWLWRTYKVCGNPGGAAIYSALFQLRGTESAIMRDIEFITDNVSPIVFRNKLQRGIADELARLVELLGHNIVAPVFFLALLHAFKNRQTGRFRWPLLCMWAFAVIGMSAFGSDDAPGLSANELNILFIPMFTAYGLAFVLGLWSRLEINVSLVQKGFVALIFFLSALPMVNTLMNTSKGVFQWPPYVPPSIAALNAWTTDQEIIASDMPWAVAWYADRKSLWLPNTLQEFIDLNDYNRLGGRIVGLYLTPVTGNMPLIDAIVKGEYKEWAPFILRTVNAKDFPLRAATALPIDGQCIFYADHDRWSDRLD